MIISSIALLEKQFQAQNEEIPLILEDSSYEILLGQSIVICINLVMFIIILNASEIVDGLHRNSSAASFCDNLSLNAMDLIFCINLVLFIIILNASEVVDGSHRNSSAASFFDNLYLQCNGSYLKMRLLSRIQLIIRHFYENIDFAMITMVETIIVTQEAYAVTLTYVGTSCGKNYQGSI